MEGSGHESIEQAETDRQTIRQADRQTEAQLNKIPKILANHKQRKRTKTTEISSRKGSQPEKQMCVLRGSGF